MISKSLAAALADLSTERIQRLVDAIEGNPAIELTVGSWLPACPMVAAGFEPQQGFAPDCPERRFAAAWDRLARAERWHLGRPALLPPAKSARRSDVQALLRAANEVLAARGASADATERSLTTTRSARLTRSQRTRALGQD